MTPQESTNKAFVLEQLMLLSALESWAFSTKQYFPDYLQGQLTKIVQILSAEILKRHPKNYKTIWTNSPEPSITTNGRRCSGTSSSPTEWHSLLRMLALIG